MGRTLVHRQRAVAAARRPGASYEADAYLNQLSHCAVDPDVQMARDTFDRLAAFPSWPTEWASHMVFIAHADFVQTGNLAWLLPRYESLRPRLPLDRARALPGLDHRRLTTT